MTVTTRQEIDHRKRSEQATAWPLLVSRVRNVHDARRAAQYGDELGGQALRAALIDLAAVAEHIAESVHPTQPKESRPTRAESVRFVVPQLGWSGSVFP